MFKQWQTQSYHVLSAFVYLLTIFRTEVNCCYCEKKSIMMQINGYVFMHITVLGVALKIHLLSLHVSIKTNNEKKKHSRFFTHSNLLIYCNVSLFCINGSLIDETSVLFIKWISRFSLFITIDLYCQSINLTGSRFNSSRCE